MSLERARGVTGMQQQLSHSLRAHNFAARRQAGGFICMPKADQGCPR